MHDTQTKQNERKKNETKTFIAALLFVYTNAITKN